MKIKLSSKNAALFDEKIPFRIINAMAILMILLAFIFSTPNNIAYGLREIVLESGTLITDYIEIGGIGGSLFNAGLLTIIFNIIVKECNVHYNGTTYAAIFLLTGFSFFGKNIVNVWPIVIGVYFYSLYQKESFKNYIYIAIFGTAMSPIISEIIFFDGIDIHLRIILGMITGILIGFILPNVAAHVVKFHHGFNLYNVGFASGIIGTIIVSIYKSYGLEIDNKFYWSTGNNTEIGIFLYIMFLTLILLGYKYNEKSFKNYNNIFRYSGRLVTDFVGVEGHGITYINMGVNGVLVTTVILALGGDLNGGTIAGIMTIVGFGGFGKHAMNIIPLWIGVFLSIVTKDTSFSEPGVQLAFLFSTGLAPIAGEYGWKYGILAGFIHSSVVMYVGVLHGGINLYNNGFAAGIIAGFLVPFIDSFRKEI